MEDGANSFRIDIDIPQEEDSSCDDQDDEIYDYPAEVRSDQPSPTIEDGEWWD